MTKRKSAVKEAAAQPEPSQPKPKAKAPTLEVENQIVFARTRYEYDSYRDFFRLVELSGFPLVYVDEINPDSSNTYIFSPNNGETMHGWAKKKRARIILWQLEWIKDDREPEEDKPFEAPPGVDEVWSSDVWHGRRIDAKYVPMGSHPGLAADFPTVRQMEYDYDLAYLAYLTNRRQWIRDRLSGFKVSPSSAWGQQRHDILSASRMYLHVHQWDHIPTIAPLRMVVAAAYGLPVLSEEVIDKGIFEGKMVTERYERLLERVGIWLNYAHLQEYGQALQQLLTVDWTFRKSVEANV